MSLGLALQLEKQSKCTVFPMRSTPISAPAGPGASHYTRSVSRCVSSRMFCSAVVARPARQSPRHCSYLNQASLRWCAVAAGSDCLQLHDPTASVLLCCWHAKRRAITPPLPQIYAPGKCLTSKTRHISKQESGQMGGKATIYTTAFLINALCV